MHFSTQAFRFGDERGILVAAALSVAFALLVGFIVFRLLSHRQSRRPQFRGMGTWPMGRSAVTGLALSAAIFGAFYWTSLRGFRELVISDDAIVLTYTLPPRTVSLVRSEVREVLLEADLSGRFSLVLATTGGEQYASLCAPCELVEAVGAKLRARR